MYIPIDDPFVPIEKRRLKKRAPADSPPALDSPDAAFAALRTTLTEDEILTPHDLFKQGEYVLSKSIERAMGWRNAHEDDVIHIVIRQQVASRGLCGSDTPTAAGSTSQVPHPLLHLAKPFYRAYNEDDHFFTTSRAELDNACNNFGYFREGVACKLWTTEGPGLVPLYRWWNGQDHCYTQSPSEHKQDNLENNGEKPKWFFEEITGYILATHIEGTVPFYRIFCSEKGDHHYTASKDERDLYISGGHWVDEGSVGFVVPP